VIDRDTARPPGGEKAGTLQACDLRPKDGSTGTARDRATIAIAFHHHRGLTSRLVPARCLIIHNAFPCDCPILALWLAPASCDRDGRFRVTIVSEIGRTFPLALLLRVAE